MQHERTFRPRVKPELAEESPRPPEAAVDRPSDLVYDSVVSEPLRTVIGARPHEQVGVLIEMRTTHGISDAREHVADMVAEVTDGREQVRREALSPYATVALDAREVARLIALDTRGVEDAGPPSPLVARESVSPAPRRFLHRLWPNFEIGGLLTRSAEATKCRAAQRTFDAHGQDIVWAVLDSGIDEQHVHFRRHANLVLPAGLEPRSFIPESDHPLKDENGHGTHVAGIIAGGLAPDAEAKGIGWFRDAAGHDGRRSLSVRGITGMAPRCKLLSCKVLNRDRSGDITALLEALLYIQELNDQGRNIRVHGVNISVGHTFDPRWFAAGRTPVCREVDRLVRSGVVVVVAAGNTGYGYAKDPSGRPMRLGFDTTINDPGNADLAITVGATSSSPHTTGVSYFSSKGPTGDGRMKPDLVAPGERIISAAAGRLREQAAKEDSRAQYIENTGTSMAAPHVSGAMAGFLSVKREFIGQPERVKQAFVESATDLGRARIFQGAGMMDAMRALQSL